MSIPLHCVYLGRAATGLSLAIGSSYQHNPTPTRQAIPIPAVSTIGSHRRSHTDGAYYPEAHHAGWGRALAALRPVLCLFAGSHIATPYSCHQSHNGPPGRELRPGCILHRRLEEAGEQQTSCYGARCDHEIKRAETDRILSDNRLLQRGRHGSHHTAR